jgi:isochorismate synthase EntC
MSIYVDQNYTKVAPKVLITAVQEMYHTRLLEYTEHEKDQKFWFRRQIYEHIHVHAPTQRVMKEMQLQYNNAMSHELAETMITIDPVTGQKSVNARNAKLLLDNQVNISKWLKELAPYHGNSYF